LDGNHNEIFMPRLWFPYTPDPILLLEPAFRAQRSQATRFGIGGDFDGQGPGNMALWVSSDLDAQAAVIDNAGNMGGIA
jgi:hypothetical protein